MMFKNKRIGVIGFAMMLVPWIQAIALLPSHAREATFRNSVEMDFVLIQPGSFLMGSPNSATCIANTRDRRRFLASNTWITPERSPPASNVLAIIPSSPSEKREYTPGVSRRRI